MSDEKTHSRINPRFALVMLVIMFSVLTVAYLNYGFDGVQFVASIIGSLTILLVFPFSWLVRVITYVVIAVTFFEASVPEETNALIVVTVLCGELLSLLIRNWRSFASMMGMNIPAEGDGPKFSVLYFYMLFRDIGFSVLFAIGDLFSGIRVGRVSMDSDTSYEIEDHTYAKKRWNSHHGTGMNHYGLGGTDHSDIGK
ncbi:hypothetical protein [Oceanisphaera sp. IT1-181]|uniref:hypothetical protein n=1 Tax=Oceanisphaera sp. IT1-181 TaxID=3081199 RepID=UPI0029C9E798|nr:hypothetical protein [Oceanisphaera sp. IT1-181]